MSRPYMARTRTDSGPSIDVLFRRLEYGRLAGRRRRVQDEATSQYFGMSGAAILTGGVDEVLPLDAIAPAVLQWTPAPK